VIIGGHESILLVEDNASLRQVGALQLEALGYHVHEAENARAALTILAGDASVDLLFTDVVMPGGMDGIELAQRAVELRPKLKVLLTSGFPDIRSADYKLLASRFRLVNKPYCQEEIACALREQLDSTATVLTEA
jgi:CheY-like chemotaxis protein